MVYDYIVIGSGFGGSVASLCLKEKGYKLLTLEQGKPIYEVSKQLLKLEEEWKEKHCN